MLATELNEHPLPPDRGFPLRAVVPGWIGARSVKWLGRIVLAAEPSDNYFQRSAYRVQREMDPHDPRSVVAGVALAEVPLNAVILAPTAGEVVAAGRVKVRGWAMGRGGCRVRRVEVSADGGRTWGEARIAFPGSEWTWSLWETEVELAPGPHALAVRASDTAGASQPATVAETWNVKGYANNAWHRVPVRAE
jgi:sulfite oxidase